ncbi:fatty acyl-CoA hydrolase precursor, medium chain [Bemisia tabaci]|uniref:fatty acyl-CoA hydrolase precursor, medium chain n=1 Tax=Bemisia tabaci TaxID=7038 RepID=UPI003B2883CF
MRWWLLLVWLGWCFAARPPPTVTIPGQGAVFGKEITVSRSQRAIAYLGIPYAEPPLKERRFLPPRSDPPPAWKGLRDATFFRNACMQSEDALRKHDRLVTKLLPDEKIVFHEDCLYLNIFLPEGKVTDPWPVIVWLHPGDFRVGAANFWDGSALAVKQKVIVVTLGFRLGIFGFLTTLDNEIPGNNGLLDQVAALDWVQRNIQLFGGAPSKVLLAGHGAGGISVGLHLVSPLSAGKFSHAIAMSGSALAPHALQRKKVQANLIDSLAVELGCHRTPTSDLRSCLQQIDTRFLMEKVDNVDAWGPILDQPFVNESGRFFLAELPVDSFQSGRFAKVPFLTGYVKMEDAWEFFDSTENRITQEQYEANIMKFAQETEIELMEEEEEKMDEDYSGNCTVNTQLLVDSISFYYSPHPPIVDDTVRLQQYLTLSAERKYGAGAFRQAYFMCPHGPTYVYRFDYKLKTNGIMDLPDWLEVPHMFELIFVWGMPYWSSLPSATVWNAADKRTADVIMAMWTSFLRTSNPIQSSLNIKWDKFTAENPAVILLDRNFDMNDGSLLNYKSFEFWNEYYPRVTEAAKICCNLTATAARTRYDFFATVIVIGANLRFFH